MGTCWFLRFTGSEAFRERTHHLPRKKPDPAERKDVALKIYSSSMQE